MSYSLAVDLGTTWTAAATVRGSSAAIAPLGTHTTLIPSLVYLASEGDWLVGEAARRRGTEDPGALAREFKRRFGDDTRLILQRRSISHVDLTRQLLTWVIDWVSDREGGRPEHLRLTHPATWGPDRRAELSTAVPDEWAEHHSFISEPEAVAAHYAAQERVPAGAVVGVFDFGGGTFDATVLRKEAQGFSVLGVPMGLERVGGIDVDDVIFELVEEQIGPAWDQIDRNNPAHRSAVQRLRWEVTAAKEALSSDVDALVPPVLPGQERGVRLTRAQVDDRIRPLLAETVESMRGALAVADLEPERVDAILLAGGSSRIPLVGELLAGVLGRRVAVDTHPKLSVASGAGLSLVNERVGEATAAMIDVDESDRPGQAALADDATGDENERPPPPTGTSPPERSWLNRLAPVAGFVVTFAVVAGLAVLLFGGDGDSGAEDDDGTTAVTAAGPIQPRVAPTIVGQDPLVAYGSAISSFIGQNPDLNSFLLDIDPALWGGTNITESQCAIASSRLRARYSDGDAVFDPVGSAPPPPENVPPLARFYDDLVIEAFAAYDLCQRETTTIWGSIEAPMYREYCRTLHHLNFIGATEVVFDACSELEYDSDTHDVVLIDARATTSTTEVVGE